MILWPSITLTARATKRINQGHPWIYSNEIDMKMAKKLPPDQFVRVLDPQEKMIAIAFLNTRSLICGRVISWNPHESIDIDFWRHRLESALNLRKNFLKEPFYRLIHAEADGFPGMVIDRFGDILVIQLNTGASEFIWQHCQSLISSVLSPKGIVLRRDSSIRELEGLNMTGPEIIGQVPDIVRFQENQTFFFANLREGQKTGWFFDQRDQRHFVATFCKNKTVLDCYCFSGGFAVQAAKAGAQSVRGIDRSAEALELAAMAAAENKLQSICAWQQQEVFKALEDMQQQNQKFDVVIVDPPAFIKSNKDLVAGSRGYRKLAKLSAAVVEKEGFLFFASCSYHMSAADLLAQINLGLNDAKRQAKVLYCGQAGIDHPIHPALPETAYLKAYLLQIF